MFLDKVTNLIPLHYRLLFVAILMASVVGAIYYAGMRHVQKNWDLEKAQTAQQIAELKAKAAEATTEVVTRYVDRVKTVVEKGDTIVRYVDRVITEKDDAECTIPQAFVKLHDAAAQNVVPKENTVITGVTSTVQLTDVAKTTFGNYKIYNQCVEQVYGLQDWIKTQQKIFNKD